MELISPIIKVEKKSSFINSILDTGELFYPLKLTSDEAFIFLKEIPIYESCRIKCRIPNWWKKKNNAFSISLKIKDASTLSAESILSMAPSLYLSGVELSRDELENYLNMSEGLKLIKNKWVEVDHNKLKTLLQAYDEIEREYSSSEVNIINAITGGLYDRKEDIFESVEVDNISFIREFIARIKKDENSTKINLPKTFKGTLRPYQKEGVTWLNTMTKLRLGVCLADDMGLGKTIQVLAYLENLRLESTKKVLLIVPTSLIGNWENEIKNFSPKIPYSLFHGNNKEISEFLTITTYGTINSSPELKDIDWNIIILDEAQNIKNPNTKQTKSIKQLNGKMKIAMTGTPIENDLFNLYSIFDFINKGLFGSHKDFKNFINSLDTMNEGYSRLKTIISPFLLRRLKTDKSIVKDLPEKMEIKEYVGLTAKQLALYKKELNNFSKSLEEKESMDRRGLILQTLSNLKQIVNHPSQYTGDNSYKPLDSGKFVKLKELCSNIYEKREKVLIFTQYREMTEPISRFLEGIFEQKGLVLHGNIAPKNRTKLVEQFNSDEYIPYMVLSLKAGGVGLNLTSANHVIHFDRWWNPAVENQATDRAFRIGQRKDVFVYKLISKGTVEEKIDEIISDKIQLSNDLIADLKKPTPITELDNHEITNLFSLF